MSNNRLDILNQYIQQKGEATLEELGVLFPQMSSMTIRRDLALLEERGEIVRIRGGAKSIAHLSRQKEPVYSLRTGENIEGKAVMAQKALEFMQPGRSVYLDAGSTIMSLAGRLSGTDASFILTSSPVTALECLQNTAARVTMVGGQLSRDNLCVSGSNSLAFVQDINVDIAFLATSGFSLETGFTTGDFNECELKRVIVKKARHAIMLMDIAKTDRYLPFTFAELSDIDVLICDAPLPEEIARKAEQAGVRVV